jgi:hypothetical protein
MGILIRLFLALVAIAFLPSIGRAQVCRYEETLSIDYGRVLEIGRGSEIPQYIDIRANFASIFGCAVDITLRESGGGVVWDDGIRFPDVGEVIRHRRSEVDYEFEVIRCPVGRQLQIRVLMDWQGSAACESQLAANEPVEGMLVTLLSDEYEVVASSEVVTLNRSEERQISYATSIAYGLGFASSSSKAVNAGISLGPLAAGVQREVSRSKGVTVGSQVSSGVATILKGDVCQKWFVIKSEKRQLISVTAPSLGVSEPTTMTLVTDVNISADALCD